MKAAYHGYLQEPPFEAHPKHEMWVSLEPQGQSMESAVCDLIRTVAKVAEETEMIRLTKGFGPAAWAMGICFKAAMEIAEIDLRDDGSKNLHWFLLRW
jgi:hypothetical protein